MPHDLITIGRVGTDLYPIQLGVALENVSTFQKYLGGSAANVACAAARHKLKSAVITRTGDDPFGRFIHEELIRLGVDDSFVSSVPRLKTPITFCEIFPPDNFPLYFYRDPIAPDLVINPDELPETEIRDCQVFWLTTTGLSTEPSRSAHHAALTIRQRNRHTILDLDYRSQFWNSAESAHRELALVLPQVTVAIGNQEECAVAVGEIEPHRAADALLERGVEIAIVKQGPKGVLAKTATETVEIPPYLVKVVNGLGAGDGFGGAFVLGLINKWSLERSLKFANIAGAIVAGRHECSTAMPTTSEVEKILNEVSNK